MVRAALLAAAAAPLAVVGLEQPPHAWARRVAAGDAAAIKAALDTDAPFVVAGALGAEACEAWTDAFVAELGGARVTAQTPGETRDLALGDFFAEAMESTHARPVFLFDESLLDGAPALRGAAVAPQRAFFGERSFFDAFPEDRRPKDCCVVGAGAGARSPLHRDPYDWTGTSLCVEGTKVWRFLYGADEAADLGAYELPSGAFGGDSAGTQSDVDLFAERRGDAWRRSWPPPSAYEDDAVLLEKWSPPANFAASAPPPPNARYVTALQRAGDVVVVPARAWHQTYALEPSLAVASQVCRRADAPRVFGHVLARAAPDAPDDARTRLLAAAARDDPDAAARALFDYLAAY